MDDATKELLVGSFGLLIIGIPQLIAVALWIRHWVKRSDELARYEFENRTDGGVVKFKDWDAAKKHQRAKVGNPLMPIVMIFFFLFGSCTTGMGCLGATQLVKGQGQSAAPFQLH